MNFGDFFIFNSMKIKELLLILLLLIPLLYLAMIWGDLPREIPLHWNAKGEIDRIGDKNELFIVLSLINIPLYFILLIVPFIDPKKKVQLHSKAYFQIRLLLQFFMAILSVFIIHSTLVRSLGSPNIILTLVGALFFGLGFVFSSIKSNYFVGIRTPWTLEDPENWNRTHSLASVVWKIGGGLLILSSLIWKSESYIVFFIGVCVLIAMIPIAYSFWYFKKNS